MNERMIRMSTEIIVAILALVGTLIGSVTGILTANKLTTYRIGQLEKKVDEFNSVSVRVSLLERDNASQWTKINEIYEDIKKIRREVTHQ